MVVKGKGLGECRLADNSSRPKWASVGDLEAVEVSIKEEVLGREEVEAEGVGDKFEIKDGSKAYSDRRCTETLGREINLC